MDEGGGEVTEGSEDTGPWPAALALSEDAPWLGACEGSVALASLAAVPGALTFCWLFT